MSLSDIPNEILLHIITMLSDFADIINFSFINKDTYESFNPKSLVDSLGKHGVKRYIDARKLGCYTLKYPTKAIGRMHKGVLWGSVVLDSSFNHDKMIINGNCINGKLHGDVVCYRIYDDSYDVDYYNHGKLTSSTKCENDRVFICDKSKGVIIRTGDKTWDKTGLELIYKNGLLVESCSYHMGKPRDLRLTYNSEDLWNL